MPRYYYLGMSYSKQTNYKDYEGSRRKVSVNDTGSPPICESDFKVAKNSSVSQLTQPFTGAILETVGYIRDELLTTHLNLTSIDDRIFGLYEGDADESDDCEKSAYGLEARILTALRDILLLAQTNRVRAANINTRL
jgi:hypothetical protein